MRAWRTFSPGRSTKDTAGKDLPPPYYSSLSRKARYNRMGIKRKMDAKLKMYCHALTQPSRTSQSVMMPTESREMTAQQRAWMNLRFMLFCLR